MSIPDFQSVMLPVLKAISSGEVMNKNDVVEQVSDAFGLSPEQRAELLPSGKQTVIKNRIGWAMTYLKKAGLVSSPKRVHIQITDLGRQVLAQHPEKINVRFLKQYESFRQFHTANRRKRAPVSQSNKTICRKPRMNSFSRPISR